MLRLDDMELFVEVVRQNSLRKAAEKLKIPVSTLSRRLSVLEKEIGVRLVRRTTRSLEVTELGNIYYQRCKPIIDEARIANQSLSDMVSIPSGLLRVSMPVDFSMAYIIPLIIKYSEAYPDISFEFDLTPRQVDLAREPLDVAIRLGEQQNSSLIARHLIDIPRYLYASPEYLRVHGYPRFPSDLCSHKCLIMNTPQERKYWALLSENEEVEVELKGRFLMNSIGMLKTLALMGEGVAMISPGVVRREVSDGALVRVLPEWRGKSLSVYALTENRLSPIKISSFIDFLCDGLRSGQS
ncbi:MULTISPECIES: LysR family transcriptional regulator [Pseudomonas]|uniref:LysR family transcriptional regulator n=1 Tax=Pseudomonas TaxID=286 RepID=UPI00174B13E8|nr:MULTISPECIES: LysR family transcriptional regulator [Pseudomonas]MBJ7561378.1 LysR family transcriptional regulator [Pseudomonas sp. P20]MBJ7569102.1 LysR family transcriptional regulator [Pseudomonas sp. P22]MBM0728205.1 LysR family transcriptional regulator [Pseudomonas aeruginosa]MBM2511396.1 LysR family transcriptional regulator [Pseudomonas aeruginosa]MBM2527706.1 LysR family transcriptional regulator [Pseudomonas aeruginosa]